MIDYRKIEEKWTELIDKKLTECLEETEVIGSLSTICTAYQTWRMACPYHHVEAYPHGPTPEMETFADMVAEKLRGEE